VDELFSSFVSTCFCERWDEPLLRRHKTDNTDITQTFKHAVSYVDVLLGRDRMFQMHDGNVWFEHATKLLDMEYYRAAYGTRHVVATAILVAVKERGGRFLLRDAKTGEFAEARDHGMIRKRVQGRFNKLAKDLKRLGISEKPTVKLDARSERRCIEKLRAAGMMNEFQPTAETNEPLQEHDDDNDNDDSKPTATENKSQAPDIRTWSQGVEGPTSNDHEKQGVNALRSSETAPEATTDQREETIVLGNQSDGNDSVVFRCNSQRTTSRDHQWSMYSVSPMRASPAVWTFFNFVLLVQIVIVLDSVIIKIWCWIFLKAPYLKSTAIVNCNGGGQMGGLVWKLARNLMDYDYTIRAIQIYSGKKSKQLDNPWAATTNHQDGHTAYEKVLFRIDGGFTLTRADGTILHRFDCQTSPRLFQGTRNVLCGEAEDGTNSGVHHQGIKSEGRPSVVIQIVRNNDGLTITEDDCKRIMMIIEDTAISIYNSGLHSSMLRIVREFFNIAGTEMDENNVSEERKNRREEHRQTSAVALQEAFQHSDNVAGTTDQPPTQADLAEMNQFLPLLEH